MTDFESLLSNEYCDLSSSLLKYEEQIQFMEQLKTNTRVKELSLNFNQLNSQVLEALCHTLQENSTLKSLNLSRTNLNSDSVSFIAQALEQNQSLEFLDLSFNPLNDEGIEIIARSLLAQKKLKQLSLKYCSFTSHSSQILGKVLGDDVPMEKLDITGNIIQDDGLHSLLECFKVRSNETPCPIQSLILWDIGITTKGAQDIIDTLQNYPNSVKELILSGNSNISSNIGNEFLGLVQQNTQICSLELAGTGIHRKLQSQISATTSENAEIPQQEKELNDFQKSIEINRNLMKQENKINSIESINNNNNNNNNSDRIEKEIEELKQLKQEILNEKSQLKKEREQFNKQKQLWLTEIERKQNWNNQREKILNSKIEENQKLKTKLESALNSVESQQNNQQSNRPRKITRKVTINDTQGNPISLHLRFSIQ